MNDLKISRMLRELESKIGGAPSRPVRRQDSEYQLHGSLSINEFAYAKMQKRVTGLCVSC